MIFLQNYNCDAIFRLSQARKSEIERGRRKTLSSFESIEIWHKPSIRPKGLSQDEFAQLPKSLTIRIIKYYISSPGYRTKQVVLATTLLNSKVYPTTKIMGLYGQRWEVELDLKHLKTTLGMDILRGKTPEMERTRNLCSFVSLQFTSHRYVGGWNNS